MGYSIEVHNNSSNRQAYNVVAMKPDVGNLSSTQKYFGCIVDQRGCSSGDSAMLSISSEYCLYTAYVRGRSDIDTRTEIRVSETHPAQFGSGSFRVDVKDKKMEVSLGDSEAHVSFNGYRIDLDSGVSDKENDKIIGIGMKRPSQHANRPEQEWMPLCGFVPQPKRGVNVDLRLVYFVECKTQLLPGTIVKFDRALGLHNIDFSETTPRAIVIHEADGSWRRGEAVTGDEPETETEAKAEGDADVTEVSE